MKIDGNPANHGQDPIYLRRDQIEQALRDFETSEQAGQSNMGWYGFSAYCTKSEMQWLEFCDMVRKTEGLKGQIEALRLENEELRQKLDGPENNVIEINSKK